MEKSLEELSPQIEAAKQRMDFLIEEYAGPARRLSEPAANARRLFDDAAPRARKAKPGRTCRARAARRVVHRLEERELVLHVLAGYELRKIHGGLLPAGALAGTEKALVSRDDAKRVEADP